MNDFCSLYTSFILMYSVGLNNSITLENVENTIIYQIDDVNDKYAIFSN